MYKHAPINSLTFRMQHLSAILPGVVSFSTHEKHCLQSGILHKVQLPHVASLSSIKVNTLTAVASFGSLVLEPNFDIFDSLSILLLSLGEMLLLVVLLLDPSDRFVLELDSLLGLDLEPRRNELASKDVTEESTMSLKQTRTRNKLLMVER